VVGYEYPISDRQSFILYQKNDTLSVVFQQDNQFVKVKRLVVDTGNGYLTYEDSTAEIQGTIFSPGFPSQVIFYMPKEIEDSLFTRMYFYNGAGLKHFTLINNWGGEVKLFRVDFNAQLPVEPINNNATSAANTSLVGSNENKTEQLNITANITNSTT
jgi:hypothetical protein